MLLGQEVHSIAGTGSKEYAGTLSTQDCWDWKNTVLLGQIPQSSIVIFSLMWKDYPQLQPSTAIVQYGTLHTHLCTECKVQHSTQQNSKAQYSKAQYSIAQHSTAQHSTVQQSSVQHRTAHNRTAKHSTTQHNTTQYSKTQYITAQGLTLLYVL